MKGRIYYYTYFIFTLLPSLTFADIIKENESWGMDVDFTGGSPTLERPNASSMFGRHERLREMKTMDGKNRITEYRLTFSGGYISRTSPEWYANCNTSNGELGVSFPISVLRMGAPLNTYMNNVAFYMDQNGQSGPTAPGFIFSVYYRMTSPEFMNPNNGISGYLFPVMYSATSGYVYSVNGTSGVYRREDGSYVYAFADNSSIKLVGGPRMATNGCPQRHGIGEFYAQIAPLDPEPIVFCDFSITGDIDLGIVDPTTARGTSSSTSLITQCTGNATVTAMLRKSDGVDNIVNVGGLDIPVYFNNNGQYRITYSAGKDVISQSISAEVSTVGILTPGEYTHPMVLTFTYE
ncbi:hypothetical protein [Providencia alcalifaciens]|uniref:hypothetical protein n=1 Tax=Providencia alcalifaciens TaxID=126385 RepID=UPI003D984B24